MIELSTTVNSRYRVERQIGSGGMAVVFLGRDVVLDRDVAIKALRSQYAADAIFRSRFEREAEAAASFDHPNIIDIYDVGEEGGTPYIVMERVSGQTLKEIIREEAPFHPDDVAALLTQVCGALDYAHARGYVHRDIKPQNILVDDAGVAKVVDFGIAKGLADSDLTELGVGLGTVHYLSPEQASGLMPTPASDIYSVGVVAFEMLTCRLPFAADTPVAVAVRHIQDPPPAPSSILPSVPAAVDAIVLKALEKDPTKRFQNAGALATAMSSWREARPRNITLLPARPRAHQTDTRPELAPTIVTPVIDVPVPPAAAPDTDRLPSPMPRVARRDDVGCATWIVGIAILLALLGLIWIGFQLTPRFTDIGGGADQVAPTVVPTAAPPVIAPGNVSGVPDLTGMTRDEATNAARSVGLQLTSLEPVFSNSVPPDHVAEQDPPPGASFEPASTIYVKLSRGSSSIDLAALSLGGLDAGTAERRLSEAGVGVRREEVPSREVAAGLVVGTEPPDRVTVGDEVTLLVSIGDVVPVPGSLQGQPMAAARAELEEAGLVVAGEIAVGRFTIEVAGVDLAAAGIEPGDVVGVQGDGADFGSHLPRGAEIELVVYDAGLDEGP